MLQQGQKCGKLVIKNGWAMCPVCGKGKLLKLLPTSSARDIPRQCKICKQETILNIEAPEPESKATSA